MLDPIAAPATTTAIRSGPDMDLAPLRGATVGSPDGGADFGSFLAQLTANTAQTLKAGEATAIAGINGQASTQQVVDAVMSTEQTLQTAIAIRDKVVSAFLELTHMQI